MVHSRALMSMTYITTAYPSHIKGAGGPYGTAISGHITGQFGPVLIDRKQAPTADAAMSVRAPPEVQHDNIMNRKGGVNSSLYQSCLALKRRLAEVPGFEPYLDEMDQEEQEAGDATDPVTSMWNMLRRGYPLMAIYNALNPEVKLEVDHEKVTEAKLGKAATFKFLQACLEELKFPANECFLITDLYGQDTTGFVKVLKVINQVLDILSLSGLLLKTEDSASSNGTDESQPRSHQQKIIDELVSSERDYVQHLETLQQFKNQIEQTGAITGDVVHDIFLNLNALLDFQRRFLIRVEQQNSLEPSMQNWGHLFVQYQDHFKVYEPFIANQQRCNDVVSREWDKIRAAPLSPAFQGMVETQSVLGAFLLKPFQRLTKYPMLLNELKKKGDLDEEKIEDIQAGIEVTTAILARANQAVDKETRIAAVEDLQSRVVDWKGHQLERFGELIVYGTHTVLKGEAPKEVEREYKIYLFERILLCCKEINPNKAKNRMTKNAAKTSKPQLQLKGRIFMQNVTDILHYARNGTYYLQIFWKGDPAVEHFVIRFPMEEKRNKWRDMVEKQKRKLNEFPRQSDPRSTGTSYPDFEYFHQNPPPQNPHDQVDDDEEDDDELTRIPSEMSAIGAHSDWSSTMSRNTSQTSLRKMATRGSGPPQMSQLPSRAAPPRFPHDDIQGPSILPLTILTNVSNPGTPDERGPKSFFSPTAESPASVWSNSQGSTFPFPRQQIPVPSGWAPDENKHKTAPPIGAPMIHAMANAYTIDGRTVQRPSLPALQQMPPNQTNRMRSQSSPDIQNPSNPAQKRYPSGQSQSPAETVPVPPIPVHMVPMRTPINRNQSGSPTDIQRRATAQSPKSSRDRLNQPQYTSHYSYDPSTQSHTRSDPRYFSGPSRSNTMSGMGERVMSPPLSSAATNDQPPYPSQLKVKIWFEPQPNYVTIVVPIIIKHRSLIDRIDSKMEKVSSSSIAKGTARLKYQDSDNEMVTMKCDEDVQIAIEEWVNVNEESLRNGVIPDFELYWNEIPQ